MRFEARSHSHRGFSPVVIVGFGRRRTVSTVFFVVCTKAVETAAWVVHRLRIHRAEAAVLIKRGVNKTPNFPYRVSVMPNTKAPRRSDRPFRRSRIGARQSARNGRDARRRTPRLRCKQCRPPTATPVPSAARVA